MYSIFFFNDTATTEIYTLSLHDALPILHAPGGQFVRVAAGLGLGMGKGGSVAAQHRRRQQGRHRAAGRNRDRKSTRLNSSHANISYAVFCLQKRKDSFAKQR